MKTYDLNKENIDFILYNDRKFIAISRATINHCKANDFYQLEFWESATNRSWHIAIDAIINSNASKDSDWYFIPFSFWAILDYAN